MSKTDAAKRLQGEGAFAKNKHEILFSEFGINYSKEDVSCPTVLSDRGAAAAAASELATTLLALSGLGIGCLVIAAPAYRCCCPRLPAYVQERLDIPQESGSESG